MNIASTVVSRVRSGPHLRASISSSLSKLNNIAETRQKYFSDPTAGEIFLCQEFLFWD